MTNAVKPDRNDALDQATLELLGRAPAYAEIGADELAQLRRRVMARVDEDANAVSPYITIRENDGPWIKIGPSIEKKVLSVDEEAGIESYLLRLFPGAAPERHKHDEDEMCIVLQGDASFDDIHLEAGDFHFARKGSWHGQASTVNGALLFLQSALPAEQMTA